MKISFLLLLTSFLFIGCNFEKPINPNILTEPLLVENAEVGWKVEVPAGWVITSDLEAFEKSDKGVQMFEESMNQEIEILGLINLLKISKYDVNTFDVTALPFIEEYINEWRITHEFWNDQFIATYADQGLTAVSGPIETVNINGVEFITNTIEVTKPGDEKLLRQTFYASLYNGFDFSASMTYMENELMEEMLAILKSSEFDIRAIPDSLATHYSNLEIAFNSYIANADQAFEQLKFGEALFWFEKANKLDPLNEYAIDQLEKCENLANDQSYSELEIIQCCPWLL
jgi:hypothetical protein